MSRLDEAQDSLVLLAGSTLLTVGLTDLHLRYAKPQMQPLLLAAGAVLVAIGLLGLLRADDPAEADAHEHADHDHAGRRSAYLLALPVLVLALVGPPSLGSYAASRSETRIAVPETPLGPLAAPRDGAVDLTLTEYYSRVLYEDEELVDTPVRLTGFVTPTDDGRWFVTRISLSCCAADGRPVKVLTAGDGAAAVPPADSWVEVVGTYTEPEELPGQQAGVATLRVASVTPVEAPKQQYE